MSKEKLKKLIDRGFKKNEPFSIGPVGGFRKAPISLEDDYYDIIESVDHKEDCSIDVLKCSCGLYDIIDDENIIKNMQFSEDLFNILQGEITKAIDNEILEKLKETK